MDRAALERLRDLFKRDKAWVVEHLSEWFWSYHSDLYRHGVPFDVYVEKARAIRREFPGARRVLDVGAGFGVYAALLRIVGVAEVTALDYHAPKAAVARKLAAYLGLDGVSVMHGDATVLPLKRGTFDAAIALASLSHIRDPVRALRRVAAALRPGGCVYVFEDNNSTHPGYHRTMSPVWEGAETGRYDHVPHEKQVPESYIAIRRRMIAERFPGMSPEALDAFAKATRGYWGRGMLAAVERRRVAPRLVPCNPVNGEVEEYPFNPFIVSTMLRRAGFEPRWRSPLTGPFRSPVKRLAARVLHACPALLPWASPIFAVVGRLGQLPTPRN